MAAATGSPASRRLTKLTPLTTRPSLTSRQGMTRILSTRLPFFREAEEKNLHTEPQSHREAGTEYRPFIDWEEPDALAPAPLFLCGSVCKYFLSANALAPSQRG